MTKERIITIAVFGIIILFLASVSYGEHQLKKQISKEEATVEAKRIYCLKRSGSTSPFCWTPRDWDAYCSKVLCKGAE